MNICINHVFTSSIQLFCSGVNLFVFRNSLYIFIVLDTWNTLFFIVYFIQFNFSPVTFHKPAFVGSLFIEAVECMSLPGIVSPSIIRKPITSLSKNDTTDSVKLNQLLFYIALHLFDLHPVGAILGIIY